MVSNSLAIGDYVIFRPNQSLSSWKYVKVSMITQRKFGFLEPDGHTQKLYKTCYLSPIHITQQMLYNSNLKNVHHKHDSNLYDSIDVYNRKGDKLRFSQDLPFIIRFCPEKWCEQCEVIFGFETDTPTRICFSQLHHFQHFLRSVTYGELIVGPSAF